MVDEGFLVTPPLSERSSLTINVRSLIGKAAWTGGEANPRFLVTSLKPIAHTQFATAACGTIRLKLLKIGAL
jgi:hypothetical protein